MATDNQQQGNNNDDFRAAIALGSNMGNRLTHLRKAAEALRRLSSSLNSVRASSIYQTAPVDCAPDSPPFLNAVVEIEWHDKLEILWRELQRLESEAGRQHPHAYNVPRPLDLDLLYLGSHFISTGPICLPHPRLKNRRFVLAPLAECAPNRILPNEKLTIQQLLTTLPQIPSVERIEEPLFT